MKHFIPGNRLSKKAGRILDRQRRVTRLFSPATRKKTYNRHRKSHELHDEWIRGIFLNRIITTEPAGASTQRPQYRDRYTLQSRQERPDWHTLQSRQERRERPDWYTLQSRQERRERPDWYTLQSRQERRNRLDRQNHQTGQTRSAPGQDQTVCFPVNPAARMVLFNAGNGPESGF